MSIKQDLTRYLDAGFPIIYINSFEETKTDRIISGARNGRELLEWNGSGGFVDFNSKQPLIENRTLSQTLRLLSCGPKELDRKILVLKDVHPYLEEREVIAQLKNICQQITADDDNDEDSGLDTAIIIVAPVVKIPRELEKFITI